MRLQCPIEADPPAIVDWEKDGEIIRFGWDRFTVKVKGKDHYLVVKDVERSDTGMYVCKAVNGFGSIVFQYTVTVYSAGWLSLMNTICTIMVCDSVHMNCLNVHQEVAVSTLGIQICIQVVAYLHCSLFCCSKLDTCQSACNVHLPPIYYVPSH